MVFTGVQPLDGNSVPISSEYSPQNNTFPAMQGADGAYVDAYGNQSTAPVMSFIQPRVVQRAVAQTGAGAKSLSCSFNAPNVGGNSIVVCLGVGDIEDAVTAFQITDTQGNIYTKCAFSLQGSTLESAIFLATGIKSGLGTNPVLNTITVNITGPTAVPVGISMKIYEVWGLIASSDTLDQSAVGKNASGLVASTGAIVPVVSNEMAFSALTVGQVATITPGNGWSSNDGTIFPWGGNLGAFDSQYRALSTIATLSPSANLSLTSAWAMVVASFRSIVVPVQGTFNFAPCANAPITAVAASLSSVQLLAADASRKGLNIFNASSGILYLAFAANASVKAYTLQIPSNVLYEMPQPIYTGVISGIWNTANGNALITPIS